MDIPTPEEEFGESPALSCRALRVCSQSQETQSPPVNLRFKVFGDAAAVDEDYQQLIKLVRSGFLPSMRDVPPSLLAYWNGREHLSLDSGVVMKGDRIVVPEFLRETVLADLHAAHQGLARTKSRARQIVFWPGITAAIEALVRSCPSCKTHQASLAKEPLLNDRQLSLPFEFTSATCSRAKAVNSWFMSIALLVGHVSQQLADPPRRMMLSSNSEVGSRTLEYQPCSAPTEDLSSRRGSLRISVTAGRSSTSCRHPTTPRAMDMQKLQLRR